MRLAGYILAIALLVAFDGLVGISASLYAGRGAAVLLALFLGAVALALWRRWDGALFALHSLVIVALLLRGLAVSEGQVVPSLARGLALLVVANGLVYAVVRLRPLA